MSLFDFDQRPIQVSVFGTTDAGLKRRENQDNFLIADLSPDDQNAVRLEPDTEFLCPVGTMQIALSSKGVLAVVADGMGGAAAGGLASKLAVSCIHHEMVTRWTADRIHTPERFAMRLRDAVEAANSMIYDLAQQSADHLGMGTTITAVGILDSFLYLAQVGDSRAYLVRRNSIAQLTRDQSLVQQLVDSGSLSEEEAEWSDQANVILQALGPGPTVEVDLSYQEVRRGDLLVLCSDGLIRTVRKGEIMAAAERTPDPACLCRDLIELANARGGPDNVTVLALRLSGLGLDEPRASDRVGHQGYQVSI